VFDSGQRFKGKAERRKLKAEIKMSGKEKQKAEIGMSGEFQLSDLLA
jgi:hypothetical protein